MDLRTQHLENFISINAERILKNRGWGVPVDTSYLFLSVTFRAKNPFISLSNKYQRTFDIYANEIHEVLRVLKSFIYLQELKC